MSKHSLTTGAFVLIGTALFTLVIFMIGGEHGAFAKHTDYCVEFADISGLMNVDPAPLRLLAPPVMVAMPLL